MILLNAHTLRPQPVSAGTYLNDNRNEANRNVNWPLSCYKLNDKPLGSVDILMPRTQTHATQTLSKAVKPTTFHSRLDPQLDELHFVISTWLQSLHLVSILSIQLDPISSTLESHLGTYENTIWLGVTF